MSRRSQFIMCSSDALHEARIALETIPRVPWVPHTGSGRSHSQALRDESSEDQEARGRSVSLDHSPAMVPKGCSTACSLVPTQRLWSSLCLVTKDYGENQPPLDIRLNDHELEGDLGFSALTLA